jgi:uncharacterized membrane protein
VDNLTQLVSARDSLQNLRVTETIIEARTGSTITTFGDES